jgi:hypothetical protein
MAVGMLLGAAPTCAYALDPKTKPVVSAMAAIRGKAKRRDMENDAKN